MEGRDRIIQFNMEGEPPFYVKFENARARLKQGTHASPHVTFMGESGIFFEVMTGRIGRERAFADQVYQVSGSYTDALRFKQITDITEAEHRRLFSALRVLSRLMP